MIRVQIGESERNLENASPQWVNEQIDRRRADGVPVCVKVLLDTADVNIVLATAECQGGGGGGRAPNEQEKEQLERWERLHLDIEEFTKGNLIAFLRQLS